MGELKIGDVVILKSEVGDSFPTKFNIISPWGDDGVTILALVQTKADGIQALSLNVPFASLKKL